MSAAGSPPEIRVLPAFIINGGINIAANVLRTARRRPGRARRQRVEISSAPFRLREMQWRLARWCLCYWHHSPDIIKSSICLRIPRFRWHLGAGNRVSLSIDGRIAAPSLEQYLACFTHYRVDDASAAIMAHDFVMSFRRSGVGHGLPITGRSRGIILKPGAYGMIADAASYAGRAAPVTALASPRRACVFSRDIQFKSSA